MIVEKKNFDRKVKNDIRTYDNILQIANFQEDDYANGLLIDYVYFKNYYKMIAIDWSKQQALYADLKVIQQINFTGNLDQAGSSKMFFIIEEAKETILDSQGTVTVLWIYFTLV